MEQHSYYLLGQNSNVAFCLTVLPMGPYSRKIVALIGLCTVFTRQIRSKNTIVRIDVTCVNQIMLVKEFESIFSSNSLESFVGLVQVVPDILRY